MAHLGFPFFRCQPHGDIWAVWRLIRSQCCGNGESPDRIVAYCDRWDDGYEIAEALNGSELIDMAFVGEGPFDHDKGETA